MAWNLQKAFFGLNFDIDIETRPPAVQEIYNFKTSRKWTGNEYNDSQLSKKFIAYALKRLPKGSFIIFNFDFPGNFFVQFGNYYGTVIADFPVWYGNCYHHKDEELTKLLRAVEFKRQYGNTEPPLHKPRYLFVPFHERGKRSIIAKFGNDYDKAADTSLLICENIFKIDAPGVFHYTSGKLKYVQ